MIFRQGDVILKKLDGDMQTSIQQKGVSEYEEIKGERIVAYGEVTGHHHMFTAGQVTLFRKQGNRLPGPAIARIESESATLVHQEHLPIQVPKGVYEIIMERTYDPFHSFNQTNVNFSINNHIHSHIQSYIQANTRTVSD